jgi:hypothetical protein
MGLSLVILGGIRALRDSTFANVLRKFNQISQISLSGRLFTLGPFSWSAG